jgi:phytoene synthase
MTDIAANPTLAQAQSISPIVAASLAACERIVRARARNFWFGLRMTPAPRRDGLYALYAWMRLGDDIVDEPADASDARRRFDAFALRSRRVMDAGDLEPSDPQSCWPAFAWMLRTFGVRRAWLDAMLAGLESDLAHQPVQTRPELDTYRHRVAGTVGMCCAAIWGLRAGVDPAHAFQLANLRGMAFQMINILRDVAQDARDQRPRTYLPADLLAKHAVSLEDLLAWRDERACKAVVGECVAIAISDFQTSAPLRHLIAPDCARVLCTMSDIYGAVLMQIAEDPRRAVQSPPASLPAWRKAMIAARWSFHGAARAERAAATHREAQHG